MLIGAGWGRKNVIAVMEDGLRSGKIVIQGENMLLGVEAIPLQLPVSGVSQYLNTYGTIIAHRIRNQFNPRFDPATEPLSSEIVSVNDNMRCGGGAQKTAPGGKNGTLRDGI